MRKSEIKRVAATLVGELLVDPRSRAAFMKAVGTGDLDLARVTKAIAKITQTPDLQPRDTAKVLAALKADADTIRDLVERRAVNEFDTFLGIAIIGRF